MDDPPPSKSRWMRDAKGWGGVLLCFVGIFLMGGSISSGCHSDQLGAGGGGLIFGLLLGIPLIAGGAALIRKARESTDSLGEAGETERKKDSEG